MGHESYVRGLSMMFLCNRLNFNSYLNGSDWRIAETNGETIYILSWKWLVNQIYVLVCNWRDKKRNHYRIVFLIYSQNSNSKMKIIHLACVRYTIECWERSYVLESKEITNRRKLLIYYHHNHHHHKLYCIHCCI